MLRRTLFTIAALTSLGLAASSHAAPAVGQPAPDFTLKDTSGKTVQLSDVKGKHMVLECVNPG